MPFNQYGSQATATFGTYNDIAGDQYNQNKSTTNNNENSGNTNTTTTENSNNTNYSSSTLLLSDLSELTY